MPRRWGARHEIRRGGPITQPPDAPLGFCEYCGAKKVIAGQGHCAVFYIEGVGWIPADPTVGQARNRDYYFGSLDNQRVILNKGVNVPLDPATSDNFLASTMQLPWWWYWGSAGDSKSVSLQRTEWTVTPLD